MTQKIWHFLKTGNYKEKINESIFGALLAFFIKFNRVLEILDEIIDVFRQLNRVLLYTFVNVRYFFNVFLKNFFICFHLINESLLNHLILNPLLNHLHAPFELLVIFTEGSNAVLELLIHYSLLFTIFRNRVWNWKLVEFFSKIDRGLNVEHHLLKKTFHVQESFCGFD